MDAQGTQTNAKEDTVFLALSGALATDLSQVGTDLTSTTGGAYETSSARTAITGSREVYVRCVLTKNEAELTLAGHHAADLSDMTFCLCTSGSGEFQAIQNGVVLWTGPGTPAGDCSVSWSTRANPDTTGASDAMISEFVVYDHTAGEYLVIAQFTHVQATTNAAWTFTVGGAWDGSTLQRAPATAPTKARVSTAFHTNVEVAEDWIAARSSHSTSLVQLDEPIGASATDLGGQGEWAGLVNVGFLAAHGNALRGRMLSPLINEVYSRARTITSTPSPAQWHVDAPGSSFVLDVTKLRWLPVPAVGYAYVRVHVQSWVTSGSAVPVAVRCYSMNRPHLGLGGTLGGKPTPPLAYTFAEASLTEDHTASGTGEWLELGILALARMVEPIPGWTNTVTMGLAWAFDPDGASSNDANARLKIKAWQVRPVLGEP